MFINSSDIGAFVINVFIFLIDPLRKLYSRPIFELSAMINTSPIHLSSIHSFIATSCGITVVIPFEFIPLQPKKHFVALTLFKFLNANSPVKDFLIGLNSPPVANIETLGLPFIRKILQLLVITVTFLLFMY